MLFLLINFSVIHVFIVVSWCFFYWLVNCVDTVLYATNMKIPASICLDCNLDIMSGLYQQLSKKLSPVMVVNFKVMLESKNYKMPNYTVCWIGEDYWKTIFYNSSFCGGECLNFKQYWCRCLQHYLTAYYYTRLC